MKLFFEQTNLLLYLLPALILAGLIVLLTYKSKSQKEFYTKNQLLILGLLRFASLFLLLLLLLAPVFQWYHYSRLEPVVLIATDNSESMKNYQETCEELINKAKKEINDVKVEYWSFGEKAGKNQDNDFSESRSDYTALFRATSNTYLPSSVASMVLIGDGIFNSGDDPVFSSQKLDFPVYAVGVGDTTKRIDAAILKVISNPTTFLDDLFPVEINLSYKQLAGENSKLAIWQDNKLVYETELLVQSNDFFHQLLVHLKAEKSGVVNYRIEITSYEKEKNKNNNYYNFSIRVLDEKQKVLILSHGAHPDLGAFIKVLDPQVNLTYDLHAGNEDKLDLSDYDLAVVHQLPDQNSANSAIIERISKSKLPVLWVIGAKTDIPRLNNLQLGFTFENQKGYEFANSRLNPQFNLFQTAGIDAAQTELWPPLQVPFADVHLSGNWQILAYQRIQQTDIQRPLICLGRNNGVKTGMIAGDGIWRWRMNDYVQNGSAKAFDELILKIINYLILKPNEDNFNLIFQSRYEEDQDVTFEAELMNESFEPVTGPEVSIQIKSESGTTYDYVFDRVDDHYELNTGNLPVGSYSFEASTQLGDQKYTESGSFRIDELQLEQIDLQANFNLLYQIASNTGGKFVSLDRFEELLQQIKKESELQENKVRQLIFRELIAIKWVAFLILFLVSMEWFLRKFWGSY